MKTNSQNPPSSKPEDPLKHSENHGRCGEKNSVEDILLPSSTGNGKKEAEIDGPSLMLAWVADASKEFTPKLGTPDIVELENMISLYLAKISSCISKCYVPNRAAKMKRCMNDVLMFFNFLYQEIAEDKKTCSTYLDKMTELMAYYIDMEIQASSRAKENPLVIASKLTSALFIFLDKSYDHILDSILKANNINRNFWELCSLIFSGVLKDTPKKVLNDLSYVRYILAFKMWKRVVQGPHERKRVMSLASVRLKAPPQFVEKTRAGLLNGIIPKVPKKRCDVTTFLIQAKFDVKEKAKAFLKYVSETKTNVMFVPAVPAIKTDIPLLVGYLPDFGPSLSLVKLDPPNLDEDDPKKVDISGSRLMNEIWTSVNHEASFREAIRMQSVTTFNRLETKMNEKKNIHCVLKHKKVVKVSAESKSWPESVEVTDSMDMPRPESPEVTIVLSDDSEKGNSKTVEVHQKSRVNRVSKSHPVRMKQEKLSPPPADQMLDSPLPIKGPTDPSSAAAKQSLINPSRIKQEVEIDDCIIMESPEAPSTEQETVADEGKEIIDEDHRGSGTVELEVSVSLKKADICQPNSPYMVPTSDKFTKDVSLNNSTCDLKEEKEVDVQTKEKEVNIRINRDLFDKIKYQDECEKEMATDDPPKLAESTLPDAEEVNITIDNDKEGLPASSADNKFDTPLFDDEESSWSPSGGSQEFFRNVVDTFISRYLPVDDVETRLSGTNVVADPPLEISSVVGSKDLPPCELFGGAISKSLDQYVSVDPNHNPEAQNDTVQDVIDNAPPPAKRCRTDKSHSDPGNIADEMVSVNKPTDSNATEQPDEQPKKPREEQEFADTVMRTSHHKTCQWDARVFMFQTNLRDTLPTNVTTPIPSPIEIDPVTGRPVERCNCSQCVGNLEALIFNYKALVGFQNDWVRGAGLKGSNESDSEGGASGVDAAALTPTDQFETKQEDERMEPDDDGNGTAESGPQLPFKKRKALVSSDERNDGESQHSDTSKDGMTVDYPATPMLSIADIGVDTFPSPPLPDSSLHNKGSLEAHVHMSDSLSLVTSFPAGYGDPPQPEGDFPYIASTETLNPPSHPGTSYSLRSNQNALLTEFGTNYTPAFPGSSFSNNPYRDTDLTTPRPPGGGFPPITAVIPSHAHFPGISSRLEQHSVDTQSSASSNCGDHDHSSQRGVPTRRFATPAQLKQAFIAKDTRSRKTETSYWEPKTRSRKVGGRSRKKKPK